MWCRQVVLAEDQGVCPLDGAKADASPTKAFFVRMLTRDITLDDCILDLVDNSIDSAWESSGQHPSELINDDKLSPYSIDITVERTRFRIVDNCGGITFEDAQNYAFTFGRKTINRLKISRLGSTELV